MLSQADRIGELMDRARDEPLPQPTLDQERADELVADIDATRSR